jgi:hypothetical protein
VPDPKQTPLIALFRFAARGGRTLPWMVVSFPGEVLDEGTCFGNVYRERRQRPCLVRQVEEGEDLTPHPPLDKPREIPPRGR